MCRIAGIIDSYAPQQQIETDVKQMCDAMAHGGPDDYGLQALSNHSAFGHRRLAIIDLSSAGHQPMNYHEFTITFNGEIYNYQPLKAELIKLNFEFTTQTDTEVILVGYQAWGTKIFAKLEGMFAFALFDKKQNVTYLVRDQQGIKPLYYTTVDKKLMFASEVKAFAETSYQFREFTDWKVFFLAFGHIPHPFTTLTDIFSLYPGSYLQWNHINQNHQTHDFGSVVAQKSICTESAAQESIKNELNGAIKSHLISDAPIGVFLSGGIDSSLIALLAHQNVGKNLTTVAINFSEADFSEEKYQQIIAKEINSKHLSCRVTAQEFVTHFDQIMLAMDQPTSDGINSWFVNRFAKENGLKAVLSGIGADELFGGYPSFKRIWIAKWLKILPKSILKVFAFLPSDKLKRVYYLSYLNPIGEYLFLRGLFVPVSISKILGVPVSKVDLLLEGLRIDPRLAVLSGKERASWFESNIFMRNQLLKDTDFMSMSHGVEVRLPFLDQKFLNTIEQITSEQRFSRQPKALLINSFKNILPEAIWNRPKMGFTFPLQKWLLSSGRITNVKGYNNNAYAIKLIERFKRGKMHWSKAFALYQVQGTKTNQASAGK